MSEQVRLTEAERDALTKALGSGSGCWDFEECCWSSFEAMLPAVEAIVAGRLARVEALADEWEREDDCACTGCHTCTRAEIDLPRIRAALASTPAAEEDA